MHIVKYLEHNGDRFVVGDRVIIKAYGRPEIEGVIETFGNHEFFHVLELQTDDGRLVKFDVEQVADIRKLLRRNKNIVAIPREEYDKLGRVWELHRAKLEEDWDICIDGVWYRLNLDMDTSDRADLLITIKEDKLELQNIPLWNCDKDVQDSGFKKMVRTDADTVYLLELEK